MGFERYKRHGIGHLRSMEKSGDIVGLLEAMDDPQVDESPRLLLAAVMGLRRLGSFDASPRILPLLSPDRPEKVRVSAARALGPMRNSIAVPALRVAFRDPSRNVRVWAGRSLGELRDRGSVEEMIDRLNDPDSAVRHACVRALGEIGDQTATQAIAGRLDDKSRTVRLAAIKALVSLRDPRGLEALEYAAGRAGAFRRRPYADGVLRFRRQND
jgi:HEAT repeat protein